jgi:hypothetical protein
MLYAYLPEDQPPGTQKFGHHSLPGTLGLKGLYPLWYITQRSVKKQLSQTPNKVSENGENSNFHVPEAPLFISAVAARRIPCFAEL